jgi:hypothetical protein
MFTTNTGNLWPMEFLCDWSIIYRNEAEMRDMVADLSPASVETATDSTGRVCFVTLRKAG